MSSTTLKIKAACTLFGLCISTTLCAEPSRKETHTISNPTGWLANAGQLNVAIGLDQNQKPAGTLSFGLGNLAEFGLILQRERSDCPECEDKRDRTLGTAVFKLGLPEDFGPKHMPGLALVFRKTLPQSLQVFSNSFSTVSSQDVAKPTAVLTAMASKQLGPIALHAGAELHAAQEGSSILDALDTPTVRPALGIAYVPPAYPDTTLLADVRWISARDDGADPNDPGEWRVLWNAAWGIRYQALDWAAVDLNLRHQQGEDAGEASATLGVRGTFDFADKHGKKQ